MPKAPSLPKFDERGIPYVDFRPMQRARRDERCETGQGTTNRPNPQESTDRITEQQEIIANYNRNNIDESNSEVQATRWQPCTASEIFPHGHEPFQWPESWSMRSRRNRNGFFPGHFKFIGELGGGAQGMVGLYERKSNKELVAVKMQKLQTRVTWWGCTESLDPKMEEMIFDLHKAGESAGLMKLHDFSQVQITGKLHSRLISEYCNGGDLNQFKHRCVKAKTKVPEGLIWSVFRALARALCFLHRGHHLIGSDPNDIGSPIWPWNSILHRDIKPENVLLQQDPKDPLGPPIFKLADFDMAYKTQTGEQSAEGRCGTYSWQPPEQHYPPYEATEEGDIWAVGATIHFLATDDGDIPGFEDYDHARARQHPPEYRLCDTIKYITPSYSHDLEFMMRWTLDLRNSYRPDARMLERRISRAYDNGIPGEPVAQKRLPDSTGKRVWLYEYDKVLLCDEERARRTSPFRQ